MTIVVGGSDLQALNPIVRIRRGTAAPILPTLLSKIAIVCGPVDFLIGGRVIWVFEIPSSNDPRTSPIAGMQGNNLALQRIKLVYLRGGIREYGPQVLELVSRRYFDRKRIDLLPST